MNAKENDLIVLVNSGGKVLGGGGGGVDHVSRKVNDRFIFHGQ